MIDEPPREPGFRDGALQLANPNYASEIEQSFARQDFLRTLGVALTSVGEGVIEMTLSAGAHLPAQPDVMHAGIGAAIANTACVYAAMSLAPPGHDVFPVEFSVNFVLPVRCRRYLCVARVVKPGHTISACEAEMFAIDDSDSQLMSKMQATLILVPRRGAQIIDLA